MIFITGSTGLVGSHLLAKLLLNKDIKLRALYRKEKSFDNVKKVLSYYFDDPTTEFNRVDWVKGDITNVNDIENALQGVEYVYHCAAYVSFDPKRETQMQKVNIEGTANIVNIAIEKKIKKFCHVSSIATLGKSLDNGRINEEDYWNPNIENSIYAITKNGAEMEVWRAIEEGLNAVIVNPSVIIGPGFWKDSSGRFITQIANGLAFYPKGGTGFVGVEDVALSMISLMDSEISSERFVLNSDNLTFKEFFDLISTELNKRKTFIKIPNFAIGIAWRLDAITSKILGKKRSLTKDSARSAKRHRYYDNSKIRKELNFEFTPMQEVVKATIEKFKSEN